MASLEKGFYTYLSTSSVTNTVAADDISIARRWQEGTPPQITFSRLRRENVFHLGGAVGLARAQIQVNCYGSNYAEARDVSEEVRQLLNGVHNTDFGSTRVRSVELLDDKDEFELEEDLSETGVEVVPMVFGVWYTETA